MTRGEIWWANLPAPWGRRPVVLLSRNEAYPLLTSVLAAPLTTRIRPIPTHIVLDPSEDDVPRPSAISLDNIQPVRKEWLDRLISELRPQKMREVDRAIHFVFGLTD